MDQVVTLRLPEAMIARLGEFRHTRKLGTMTEAARVLLEAALNQSEADPEWPILPVNPRQAAEHWRDQLLKRFVAEMKKAHGQQYVIRLVEGSSPHISALVRPHGIKSFFDTRAVVDLRQGGLVEFRVEARFANMQAGSPIRAAAEQSVDKQLEDHWVFGFKPVYQPKAGKTQFKREKILFHGPVPFDDLPANDDEIIKTFWEYMYALNDSLREVVKLHYQR